MELLRAVVERICIWSQIITTTFSRKVAITPSRNTAVVCVSRASGQKVSVEKRSGSTIEPPRTSIAKGRPMPPMWNMGMLTRKRSLPSMKCQASGPGFVYMCR